ncbi:MAG: cytochrome P450 [Pseudomonadota bacterium]
MFDAAADAHAADAHAAYACAAEARTAPAPAAPEAWAPSPDAEGVQAPLATLHDYDGLPRLRRIMRAWTRPGCAYWGAEAYRRPFVEWKAPLGPRIVVISDPGMIHRLLDQHAHDVEKHETFRRMADVTLRDGIVLSSGERWRRLRGVAGRRMSPRAVAAAEARSQTLGGGVVERIAGRGVENVDLLREAARYASTVVDDLLFRATSPRDFEETYEIFRDFDHGGYNLSPASFLLGLMRPSAGARQDAQTLRKAQRLREIYGAQVAACRRRAREARPRGEDAPEASATLMDDLLAAGDMTDDQIVSLVLELQYGGSHAAGAALAFLWYVLLARPDIAQRLRDDLASSAGEGDPPLVDAVINETLRLFPRAPIINRTPKAPLDLGGLRLRPGDFAIVSPWVVHRHEALWDQPNRFDPSRFLAAQGERPPRDRFIPFGVGARGCLSEHLSRALMRSGLKRFLALGPLRLRDPSRIGLHLTGSTLSLTPALRATRA